MFKLSLAEIELLTSLINEIIEIFSKQLSKILLKTPKVSTRKGLGSCTVWIWPTTVVSSTSCSQISWC